MAAHGNSYAVWRNLRDRFPFPAAEPDLLAYVRATLERGPQSTFALEVDDQAIGVIGLVPGTGERRCVAELSYWLGEKYWGRGIVSAAIPVMLDFGIPKFELERIESYVFAGNDASARVLEKAGFVHEGTLRRSAIKDGQLLDRWLYAYLVEH